MRTLGLGLWRRLQQATGPRGTFTVLAMDHRGPLRRQLAATVASGELDGAVADLKEDIVRALAPAASAVLLDPESGIPRCLARSALPASVGLLAALDTGSTGDPANPQTGLVPDWGAGPALRVGAVGAKLLVYYHPDAPDAGRVEALVERVARDCAEAALPFYLEPLGYDPQRPGAKLPAGERRRVVIESARRLVPLGVTVLKAEFPGDLLEEPDEAGARDACAALSRVCDVPWVLLSAGVPYADFVRQARLAAEAGASGVMAGRALWKDAVTADAAVRRKFLSEVAGGRMREVAALCAAAARPFTTFYQPGV